MDQQVSVELMQHRVSQNGNAHSNADRKNTTKAWRALGNYFLALLSVIGATAVFVFFRQWVDETDAPLFYLPVVMACAVRLGFGPALLSAVLCILSWDYFFLSPYHTLRVDNHHSWAMLIIFATTAIAGSRLAARVREQAKAAEAREQDMAALLRASELVSQAIDSDKILSNLVAEACRSSYVSFAAVFEHDPESSGLTLVTWFGDSNILDLKNEIIATAQDALDKRDVVSVRTGDPNICPGIYVPILHQASPIGVMYVRQSDGQPLASVDRSLMTTIAGHAGVVMARMRASEASRAQVHQSAILDERRRMAQEVHDTLSNTFNSIKFLLEAARRSQPPPPTSECVELALGLAVDGAQEARRSVWALRPVAFEDAAGLADAIQRLATTMANNQSISIVANVTGKAFHLPDEIEDNLYRIAQEAVTNALRHSQAARIIVKLAYTPESVKLVIEDDGHGFDKGTQHFSGFGIENMNSRAIRIGAEFKITSNIKKGTRVTAIVPITSSPESSR